MPYDPTTGIFTRVNNSFSDPIAGTVIDPTDAVALFNDYDTGLSRERILLSADTTLWVRSDGNDSHTGFANTAGGAKLTWNGLYAAAVALDGNGHALTMKSGTTNTYAAGLFMSTAVVGCSSLTIDLNGSSIAETVTKGIINNVVQTCPINIQNSAGLGTGGAIASAGFSAIQNSQPSQINIGAGITTGPCFDAHYEVLAAGGIYLTASVNIIGAAAHNLVLGVNGGIFGSNGQTFNFMNDQAFSDATVYAQLAEVGLGGATFNLNGHTITGPRFKSVDNGSIHTNNAGPTFIPGSTPGTTNTGGAYDGLCSGSVGLLTTSITGVNFNSAGSDNTVLFPLPTGYTRYTIGSVEISHASASLTTSTWGVFSGAGGTGVAVQGLAANTISTAAANTANNALLIFPSGTVSFNLASLFFRVGTAQGSAATADVTITYYPLP